MTPFKEYIASQLIGKTLHFKCDCVFPLDVIGYVQYVEVTKEGEFIYTINSNGKMIKIGSNHPNMAVSPV
jgi:hypothetical protein